MRATIDLDAMCINTMRTLAMDAVQAANSGHPGAPMALAPVAYCLWQRFLRFDPQDPIWPNRDRFVLSAGHASMLLYSLLHLTETKAVSKDYEALGEPSVPLEAIKKFRQLGSRCPGHPEYRWTSGVETTTGPLGQGLANSVGMASAGRWQAAHFGRPGFEDLIDFNVYALCGDGCMMEGISAEAASLAGHLKLSNLCWIYDNNRITIEGHTELTFSDDVATRFIGHGWNVTRVGDANDLDMLSRAFRTFLATRDRPTLIIVDSHIAFGAPNKQDTSAAHGEPLGEQEIRLTKRNYGWPEDARFLVPDGVYEHFRANIGKRGKELRDAWFARVKDYRGQHPELAEQFYRLHHRQLPENWDKDLPTFAADAKGLATRDASGKVLNALGKNVPWMLGGSADLGPSCKTRLTFEGAGDFAADTPGGRNLHFGIREHVMASVLNGMALVKVRAFGSTFLIFSDYAKPAIRLSALMELPVIYVFTHDSIGVGEDGPTHQPIEQVAALRMIPGLIVLRPGDATETVEAWKVIMKLHHQPAALVLTRQAIPTIDRTKYAAASGVARGAYVLADAPGGKPDVLLLATGSEVALCLDAHERLTADGIQSRVVSMPSWELFDDQPQDYRDSVLPPSVTARVSVEQASTFGWAKYVGVTGHSIGMRSFGASAPLKDLVKKFGFTTEHVVAAAREQLAPGAVEKGEVDKGMTIIERALELVPADAKVGLGSGRAAEAFVKALGERVRKGDLRVQAVPTSENTARLARHIGIPLLSLAEAGILDLTVDGADEVDPNLDLIKGYGRAMVREKIVAASSRRLVILVGDEKLVPRLGSRGKLPVEVIPFAIPLCERRLRELGCRPVPCLASDGGGALFVTDNGNHIVDCEIDPLPDPLRLERDIRAIPGVVGTGLFLDMADTVLVGRRDDFLMMEEKRRVRTER